MQGHMHARRPFVLMLVQHLSQPVPGGGVRGKPHTDLEVHNGYTVYDCIRQVDPR